ARTSVSGYVDEAHRPQSTADILSVATGRPAGCAPVRFGGSRNMDTLDENTLGRIADVICDTDGPNHRQGWQLPIFFRQARWQDVPEYREIGRRRWVLDLLVSRRHDTQAIEQVLSRLSDPREYQEDPRVAQRVAQELNRFLALEGLKITYAGG